MQRRQFLQLGALGLAALHFSRFAAAAPAAAFRLPEKLKNNPLLDFSGLPRFNAIKPEHVNPAIDFLLAENRKATDRLTAQKHITWDSFYLPLADIGDKLNRAWGIVGHLHGVKNSDALRKAYDEADKKVTDFQTWYGQHKGLFRSFSRLKNSPEFAAYSVAQKKAVDDALLDFRLSGIALPPAQQKQYARISARLSELASKYSNNVLDANMGWEKIITDRKRLSGLSERALTAAAENAAARRRSAKPKTCAAMPKSVSAKTN